MGFIERELDKLNAEILKTQDTQARDSLYAARQALSWALDPGYFKSPLEIILGVDRDQSEVQRIWRANKIRNNLKGPSSLCSILNGPAGTGTSDD